MTTAHICSALAATLLTAVVAGAAGQQHVPLTDAQIGAQVEHRLIEEGIGGVSVAVSQRTVRLSGTVASYAIQVNPPIHVIVQHGRVTLTGFVISEVERRKAEVIARGVFGVLGVDNKLREEGGEQ